MKKKLSLMMLLLVCLIGGTIAANAIRKAAGQKVTWEFSQWANGDITETVTVDGLTVAATSDKKVTIDGNTKTFGDVTYTKRLKLGGSGAATNRNLSFDVTGPCTITVDFAHASSSGDARTLNLDAGAFGTTVATQDVDPSAQATLTYKYEGTEATKFFVYSKSSGLNIYGITVQYEDTTEPEEPINPEEPVVGEIKWMLVEPSEIADGDIIVIADTATDRTAAMFNGNGTSAAPSAVAITLSADRSSITSEVGDDIIWTAGVSDAGFTFANGEDYVYCTNTNNGVRVGSNENRIFTIANDADATGGVNYLCNVATSRYIGIYVNNGTPQDWRCYGSVNQNIKAGRTAFYKKVGSTTPEEPTVTLPGTPVWESATAVTVDWSSEAVKADASKFADATVGDILHIDVEGVAAGEAWSAQVALKDGAWADLEASVSVGDGTVADAQFVITGDILKYIKANGLLISGTGFSTKLVTVEKTDVTGSDASIWLGNASGSVTVSANHFKNANDKSGIKAGDIIRVTASQLLGYEGNQWLILSYSGSDTNWSWVNFDDMSVTATETGFDFVVTEADVEHLLANGVIVNQGGYAVSQIEIAEPAPAVDEPQDITISPADGDIFAALAAAEEGVSKIGNITINLTEGAAYTVSAPIVAGAGDVTINGNGASVEAADVLIDLPATPVIEANAALLDFIQTGAIRIEGVKLNTKKSVVKSNAKYLVPSIEVENSVITLNAAVSPFDFSGGGHGYPTVLAMKNSTLWASVSNNKPFFTSQSSNSPKEINDGIEGANETQTIAIENSTLYNIRKGGNFNELRQKGQKFLIFTVKNNVIVNSGKDNFLQGMDGGQNSTNPVWTVDGNSFGKLENGVYTDLSAAQTNCGEVTNSILTDPQFADADNGDFTVFAGSDQAQFKIGDPRWLVEYDENLAPAKDITISPAAGADIAEALAVAEAGVKKIGNITINLAKDASYTLSAPIAPALGDIVIKGDNSAIEAADVLIDLPATPVIEANAALLDFIQTGAIRIEGVKLNTKKAVVKSNAKYLVPSIEVENSVITLNAAVSPFDFSGGGHGYPTVLTMKNSTLWASVSNNKPFFTSQSSNSPKEINEGVEGANETQTIAIENSTLYNIRKGGNFNELRQKGQKFLIFTVKNNVIVNSGKDNFLQGMDGGQNSTNPVWTVDGNSFGKLENGVYTDLSAAQTNCGEVLNSVTTNPMFADADNGDFTVAAMSDQAKYQIGDPRWLVEYEEVIPQKGEIWIAAEQEFEDKQTVEEDELFPNYQIAFSAGENVSLAPTYWANDAAVRIYKNNTFTISGKNVSKVIIHYVQNITGLHAGAIVANNGDITNDETSRTWTWVGLANEVTFTNTDITQLFIESIEVEYLSPKSVVEGRSDLADEIAKAEELLADESKELRRDDLANAIEEAKTHLYSEDPYDLQDAISALQAAEEDFLDANTPKDIVLDLATGKDIAAELAAATAERLISSITINLAPNGQYTVSAPLEAPVSIVLNGDADAPAKIDASGNEGAALILLSKTPQVGTLNGTDYYGLENLTIANVEITGIKKNIIYDNNTKYCAVTLTIDNAVLGLATEAVSNEALIAFQAGGVKDLIIKNSTVYGNGSGAKYFVRFNNSARLDRYGFDKTTEYETMTYVNNTFYNVLAEGGQWGNYSGIAGQNYSAFVIEGNIWYNCGTDIIRRLIGGRFGNDAPRSFNFNTYFNGGEDMSASEASYDNSGNILTTDPQFADAAAADFTLFAGSQQAQYQTGDPRWWSEYDPALGIANVNGTVQNFDGNWYNLQGVRVERPTKGIYIHNGKKVVIK